MLAGVSAQNVVRLYVNNGATSFTNGHYNIGGLTSARTVFAIDARRPRGNV